MPSAAGNRTGNITVAQGGGGSPLTIALSGAGVAVPDFTVGLASGSQASQTVAAGQSAQFSLAVAPTGSFTGTVNLSCSVTPTASPAPTCSLSSSGVQLGSSGAQTVTVTVGTAAPVAAHADLPPGAMPVAWAALLLGAGWLLPRRRKLLMMIAVMTLAGASAIGCGGGGSSSTSHVTTTPGTPAGTYTATVTATSGSLSHSTTMTVVVQ